jgi:GTP-binding protein EngB required for normal cell division
MSTTPPMAKAAVDDLLTRFRALAFSLGEPEAWERLQPALNRYVEGSFRLVVVGEINKGKSSFINSLLGVPDLLPTLSDFTTSTVYQVRHGPERRYIVRFYQDPDAGEVHPPVIVPPEEVRAYGTEDGNPDNEKRVDFIDVEYPSPLLASGLTIVDTPGLGGLFRQHRELTRRYLPQADAIFFVFDSQEAVASADEVECLKHLRELTPLVYFVQTKRDLIDESQWRQWEQRNREVIVAETGLAPERVVYFLVSAELKRIGDERGSARHVERSGFLPLLAFVETALQRAKEERLAGNLLRQVGLEAAGLRRRAADRLRVATAGSRAHPDALEREFKGLADAVRERLGSTAVWWERPERAPVPSALSGPQVAASSAREVATGTAPLVDVAASAPAADPTPLPVRPLHDQVLAILRMAKSFHMQSRLHVHPDLPRGKVSNARAACRIPESEVVLGLVDNTRLGSATNCFVFGARGVYYHQKSQTKPTGSLPYASFPACAFKPSTLGAGVKLKPDLPVRMYDKPTANMVLGILMRIRKAVPHSNDTSSGRAASSCRPSTTIPAGRPASSPLPAPSASP